jgi:hypothetical protein
MASAKTAQSTKSKKPGGLSFAPPSPKQLAVMADLVAALTPLPLSSSLRPR